MESGKHGTESGRRSIGVRFTSELEEDEGVFTTMSHIRCFTCQAVIAQFHDDYFSWIRMGRNPVAFFTEKGIDRECCRMNIAHPAVISLGKELYDPQKVRGEKSIGSVKTDFEPPNARANAVIDSMNNTTTFRSSKVIDNLSDISSRSLDVPGLIPAAKAIRVSRQPTSQQQARRSSTEPLSLTSNLGIQGLITSGLPVIRPPSSSASVTRTPPPTIKEKEKSSRTTSEVAVVAPKVERAEEIKPIEEKVVTRSSDKKMVIKLGGGYVGDTPPPDMGGRWIPKFTGKMKDVGMGYKVPVLQSRIKVV